MKLGREQGIDNREDMRLTQTRCSAAKLVGKRRESATNDEDAKHDRWQCDEPESRDPRPGHLLSRAGAVSPIQLGREDTGKAGKASWTDWRVEENRWSKEARCEKADRGHVSATSTVEHARAKGEEHEPREQTRGRASARRGNRQRGEERKRRTTRGKQTVLRQFWHCYQHERLSANPGAAPPLLCEEKNGEREGQRGASLEEEESESGGEGVYS
ncbi:hypothetical protein K0M31_002297 [Melipona bicolor]|uniref:Uncharacterized protein n=1 Tax=Melipona bicolor TaxID=60889 RepID=A0AA40GH83_9HYME|nr:hypothetical protein K0M31_002297 [Melipona bicolor]